MMPVMSDDDALLDVISAATGINRDRLTDETSLFHDCGVAGLDGEDMLKAIGRQFDLDVSQVDWPRYFGDELPYNPIYHLWCLIRGRRLDADIVRLRISDLRRSVAAGRWIEPAG